MSLTQLNFQKRTKVEEAIHLIQENEPSEGYQVCVSAGPGKDSHVTADLCRRAGAKHELIYNRTGIDPPEAIRHLIEVYPDVIIEKPEMSIWRWIERKGLPRRQSRWCCEKLKEYSGKGRVLLTGIRAEESTKRRARHQVEKGKSYAKKFVNPIFYWSEYEVWEYIEENHLDYCKLYDVDGWDRLGCILCPMTTWRRTLFEWKRYPKIAEAWFRAAARYWAKRFPVWQREGNPNAKRFPDPETFIWWWLGRGELTAGQMKLKTENLWGLKIKL